MKRILCLLILLSAWSPTWAQPQPGPEPALPPNAVRTQDGLIIIPVTVQKTVADELLGVEIWRFKLQMPAPNQRLGYRLELRRPGKSALLLTNNDHRNLPRDTELTLGLLPEGGFISTAPRLSYYIHLDITSTRGGVENPIKDLKFEGSSTRADVSTEGSIVLMQFETGETQEPKQSQLVLVLSAPKPPEPPQ